MGGGVEGPRGARFEGESSESFGNEHHTWST